MITVHVNGSGAGIPGSLLERAVEATLLEEGLEEGEVSLTLLDDEGMGELNRRYLGRDRATDVLAFALHEEGEPPLGDVYVGADRARAQAGEAGIDLREELVRLAIHGTLHVLGWNHPEEEREESPMFGRQETLVRAVLEAS